MKNLTPNTGAATSGVPFCLAPLFRLPWTAGCGLFSKLVRTPCCSAPVGECLGTGSKPGNLIPSMRRNQEELTVMLSSLGALYAAGCAVAWKNVYSRTAPPVALPAYPYQRQRYWFETRPAPTRQRHSIRLLGVRLRSPSIKGVVFETRLDLIRFPTSPTTRWKAAFCFP